MVLTKLVSLCFLTSAAVIFVNVLTGRHQELADEVSSVLHQSFTRSTYEIHDPQVMEVRHEVITPLSACPTIHTDMQLCHAAHSTCRSVCTETCMLIPSTLCGVPDSLSDKKAPVPARSAKSHASSARPGGCQRGGLETSCSFARSCRGMPA